MFLVMLVILVGVCGFVVDCCCFLERFFVFFLVFLNMTVVDRWLIHVLACVFLFVYFCFWLGDHLRLSEISVYDNMMSSSRSRSLCGVWSGSTSDVWMDGVGCVFFC